MMLSPSYIRSMASFVGIVFVVYIFSSGCAPKTPTESRQAPTKLPESTPSVSESNPETSDSVAEATEPVVASEASSSSAEWATLRGQFVYDGQPPEPKFLAATKDVEFCGKNQIPDESLVVNQANNGIADIVLYLRKKPSKISSSYDEGADQMVVLDNSLCRFEPYIQFVRTGQELVIGNKDAVGHNTNLGGLTSNPAFNQIIPALGSHKVTFDEPERRPVPLSCNIHPWMNGYVVVKDHPYMTKTDRDGNFEIRDLPTGEEIEVQLWHGSGGYIRDVSGANAEISRKGRVKLTLDGDFDLGTVKVDPSNFEK